jgi:hypothetical protein
MPRTLSAIQSETLQQSSQHLRPVPPSRWHGEPVRLIHEQPGCQRLCTLCSFILLPRPCCGDEERVLPGGGREVSFVEGLTVFSHFLLYMYISAVI